MQVGRRFFWVKLHLKVEEFVLFYRQHKTLESTQLNKLTNLQQRQC